MDCGVSLPCEVFAPRDPFGIAIILDWGLRTYSPYITLAFTEDRNRWYGDVIIQTRGPAEEPDRRGGFFIFWQAREPPKGTVWQMLRDALSDDD